MSCEVFKDKPIKSMILLSIYHKPRDKSNSINHFLFHFKSIMGFFKCKSSFYAKSIEDGQGRNAYDDYRIKCSQLPSSTIIGFGLNLPAIEYCKSD